MTALGLQVLFSNATASAPLSAGPSATQTGQADQVETPFAALWQLLAGTLAIGSQESTSPLADTGEGASPEWNLESEDKPALGEPRARAGTRAKKNEDSTEDAAGSSSPSGQAAVPAVVTPQPQQPLTEWTGCWWAGRQPAASVTETDPAPAPTTIPEAASELAHETVSAAPSAPSGTTANGRPAWTRLETASLVSLEDAAESDCSQPAEGSAPSPSFGSFVPAFDPGIVQPSPVSSGQTGPLASQPAEVEGNVSISMPAAQSPDPDAPGTPLVAAAGEPAGKESSTPTEPAFQMHLRAGDGAVDEPGTPAARAAVGEAGVQIEAEASARSVGNTSPPTAVGAADTDFRPSRAEAGRAPEEVAGGAATAEPAPVPGPAEPVSGAQDADGGETEGEDRYRQPDVRSAAPRVRNNDTGTDTADAEADPSVDRGTRASDVVAPQDSAPSNARESLAPRPAGPAAAHLEAAEVELEQPAEAVRAPSAARDISLRLDRGEQRVEVRVTDRGGDVQVAVRASDSRLADDLRQDLSSLTNRLEDAGFRTEAWHGGVHVDGRRDISESAASGDAQSNMQSDANSRERQNQSRENRDHESPDRNKPDGKPFGGLFTSFTKSLS